MRRVGGILIIGAAIAAAVAILWFAGPKVARDTTITFDPAEMGEDVDAWLAAREQAVPGIREGLAKEIVWAFPASRARTPLALVYVHGFSASKYETRPVSDNVAKALGANLFYTRLTGHGRDGPAMAQASVNAWINDFAEALAIGHAIGERVVVIAVSTGGSIATWAAARPEFRDRMAGLVLISPNFGVRAAGAGLLAGPWGLQIGRLVAGRERGFEPATEAHRLYWTTRYPIEATLPMAAIVQMAASAPIEKIEVPALFIFSDKDQVVRPEITRAIAARWGAPHEILAVETSEDPSNHVIAGDALSPSNNDTVSQAIIRWIGNLPQ